MTITNDTLIWLAPVVGAAVMTVTSIVTGYLDTHRRPQQTSPALSGNTTVADAEMRSQAQQAFADAQRMAQQATLEAFADAQRMARQATLEAIADAERTFREASIRIRGATPKEPTEPEPSPTTRSRG